MQAFPLAFSAHNRLIFFVSWTFFFINSPWKRRPININFFNVFFFQNERIFLRSRHIFMFPLIELCTFQIWMSEIKRLLFFQRILTNFCRSTKRMKWNHRDYAIRFEYWTNVSYLKFINRITSICYILSNCRRQLNFKKSKVIKWSNRFRASSMRLSSCTFSVIERIYFINDFFFFGHFRS